MSGRTAPGWCYIHDKWREHPDCEKLNALRVLLLVVHNILCMNGTEYGRAYAFVLTMRKKPSQYLILP